MELRTITMKKKPTVYKSNALVQAGYKLDINEQRIILDCISQVNSAEKILKKDTFEVSAQSLIDQWGVESKNAYRDLKKAADSLFQRYITIDLEDHKTLKTRWISSIVYLEKKGVIEVCFAQRILPYLSQLKAQFTKYELKHVSKMKSIYGVRLYELLVQYKQTGFREIEISWLRQKFQIGDDEYLRMHDFKKRVIEPALKDINETSDLFAKYTQKKQGKHITHFLFEFGLKSVSEAKQPKKQRLTKKYIEQNALPGESWENAKKRLSESAV